MRESKYQDTISSLAKDLEYIRDIDEEIKEIDADIEQMNNAVREYMIESVKKGKPEKKKSDIKKTQDDTQAMKESA